MVRIARWESLFRFEMKSGRLSGTLHLLLESGGPWIWWGESVAGEAEALDLPLGRIHRVRQHGLDRRLEIRLDEGGDRRILIQLFGGRGGWGLFQGNRPIQRFGRVDPWVGIDDRSEARAGSPDGAGAVPGEPLLAFLEERSPLPSDPGVMMWGLGPVLGEMVEQALAKADPAEVFGDLRKRLEGRPRILLSEGRGERSVLIPDIVPRATRKILRVYEDVQAALEEAGRSALETAGLEKARREAGRIVREQLARARRTMRSRLKAREEAEHAPTTRRMAELLAAHRAWLEKGMDKVTLDDLYRPDSTMTIPLDPAKSPDENIAALFKKAGKLERSRSRLEALLEDSRASVKLWEERSTAVEGAEDPAVLRRFIRSWRAGEGPRKGRRAMTARPFRRLHLSGDWWIWIGRNNKENDELTLRHAGPRELWFHAQGVAGSHVVLKGPPNPPRKILERAAAAAAYYSKARGSAYAPVIYTERRYVRKPRGAPAGSVVCQREKTLFVEPALPARDPAQALPRQDEETP